jgi:hypothetical protein
MSSNMWKVEENIPFCRQCLTLRYGVLREQTGSNIVSSLVKWSAGILRPYADDSGAMSAMREIVSMGP